ncbi:MAG: hypothetical protein ACXVVQ_12150 [Solirubrobacteraceae bacterium]
MGVTLIVGAGASPVRATLLVEPAVPPVSLVKVSVPLWSPPIAVGVKTTSTGISPPRGTITGVVNGFTL